MRFILCFLFIAYSFCLLAKDKELGSEKINTTPGNLFEYSQKTREKLEEIKKLDPREYVGRINEYRAILEKYIDHKKRVCDGEFSTIILGPDDVRMTEDKGLSKTEIKLCLEELKAFQITYINHMFVARKRFIDHVHDETLKNLNEVRKNSIDSLHSNFKRAKE